MQLVDHLSIRPRDDSIDASSRLYKLALQRGFTRGRRTALVCSLPMCHSALADHGCPMQLHWLHLSRRLLVATMLSGNNAVQQRLKDSTVKDEFCCAQVAAACLYIVCRQDKKPFMLIDFSDALQINVFMLGNVFLQLCKLLRLQEQPMFHR